MKLNTIKDKMIREEYRWDVGEDRYRGIGIRKG